MPRRVTIETILRDSDDMTGSSVREWKIEADRGHITIRLRHGDGFLMLPVDDVEKFVVDVRLAEGLAKRQDG